MVSIHEDSREGNLLLRRSLYEHIKHVQDHIYFLFTASFGSNVLLKGTKKKKNHSAFTSKTWVITLPEVDFIHMFYVYSYYPFLPIIFEIMVKGHLKLDMMVSDPDKKR
jgi:hypothetical protein